MVTMTCGAAGVARHDDGRIAVLDGLRKRLRPLTLRNGKNADPGTLNYYILIEVS
jgi:hypothetical protein